MEIQRYLLERSVDSASGSQVFYVDAISEEEAIRKHKLGEGDIYANECEVTSLGEPYVTGTVELDDFGMSGEKAPNDVSNLINLLYEIGGLLNSNDPMKARISEALSTQSATIQSASRKRVVMMSGKKNNSYAEAQDVLDGLKSVPGFLAGYIDEKEYRVVSFHEDAQPSGTLCAGQKRVDFSLAA